MSGIMYKNRPYVGGGGAGGASALSDLTDTSISSPTNGQVLKYNNGFWENDDESGGTTVVANPQGEASTQLNKLQVGNDIYSIPSGGGSSDDYSTTEQTIGSWIDGKPIYQITYEPSSTLHTNGKAWVDTGMVISDIESIIDFEIVAKDTYVNKLANIKCAFFRYNNNNIQIYVVDQWYLDILAVTVKYTKTTD